MRGIQQLGVGAVRGTGKLVVRVGRPGAGFFPAVPPCLPAQGSMEKGMTVSLGLWQLHVWSSKALDQAAGGRPKGQAMSCTAGTGCLPAARHTRHKYHSAPASA